MTNHKTYKITNKDHIDTLVTFPTTSGKIRYLDSVGYKRSEIEVILNIRYQHVRNVLITPLKKS